MSELPENVKNFLKLCKEYWSDVVETCAFEEDEDCLEVIKSDEWVMDDCMLYLIEKMGQPLFTNQWVFYAHASPGSSGGCYFYKIGNYFYYKDDYDGDGPYELKDFWKVFKEKNCRIVVNCEEQYIETILPIYKIQHHWKTQKNGLKILINDKCYTVINGTLHKIKRHQNKDIYEQCDR